MRHRARITRLLVTLMALLAPCATRAAVPSTMSYQGVLTNDAGQPLPDGNYSLTFRLYFSALGGIASWTETQPAVPLSKGVFSVTLGNVAPLDFGFDNPIWLGVSVGTDPELSPRTALTAAPYALGLRTPLPGVGWARSDGNIVTGNVNPPADALFRDLNLDIAVPTAGYVVVQASGYVQTLGVPTGAAQYVKYQISETTGIAALTVPAEPGREHFVGFGQAPNTGFFDWPFSIVRGFQVLPGVHRFSLCSGRLGSFDPPTSINNLVMIATFYANNYGSVTSAKPATGSLVSPSAPDAPGNPPR